MAVSVKPAKKRILAIVLGLAIGAIGLFFGFKGVMTRAVDETPRAVTITNIKSTTASITWETGTAVQGAVKYGKGPADTDLTAVAPELEQTKDHKVDLTLLEAATTYYFKIVGGTDTEYTNNGSAWSFTTANDDGSIPTSGGASKAPVKRPSPIQRIVIDQNTGEETSTVTINCQTEQNCNLIKSNFVHGCSTSDYIKCRQRVTTQ